ncbi:MAG TPA: hypothetical protein VFV97_16730 [Rhodanobacteraceae bacterium]|nr:hypothetical protein [Rhodanobacteraceae bacterium]
MMSLGEKIFWGVVALSSVGAAAYGYQRFKQIRPDLYGTPQASTMPEEERKARIAEYQQKGDALTRAAAPPAPTVRAPLAGETCLDGVVVTTQDGKPVVENGRPVRCPTP